MTSDFELIGKLNKEILENEFGKLSTDEIILTKDRDNHIKERHEKDYNLFHQCVNDVIGFPDTILRDYKNDNTVFFIKNIEGTNINIVIKLVLETENSGRKNSIITSYQLGTKTLKRIKKNNKILYNHE